MCRQADRESSRAWIASGATVTIKAYARRYGVDPVHRLRGPDRHRIPLPGSARQGAHRPPLQPCQPRSATPRALLDDDWIMTDGRPYLVAGSTAGGARYGICLDEMDDGYLTGLITPGRPGNRSGLDLSGR
jgi:hypothetical protein